MVRALADTIARLSIATFWLSFYTLQMLELAVGLVQLTLMGMSFRDGLKLGD